MEAEPQLVCEGGFMTWNYRVMLCDEHNLPYYVIVEAYYDADGNIEGTTGAIKPIGESEKELRADLELMLKAFDLPILDSNLPQTDEREENDDL